VSEDDVVAARLRSVLAATTDDVRDRAAPAAPRRLLYGGPATGSRYATALTDLAEVGEPLDWSDVVPSWPDDVDLDPLPDPRSAIQTAEIAEPAEPAGFAEPAALAEPAQAAADPTSGYPSGTAWASPPGSVPADTPPAVVPTSPPLGDLMRGPEPFCPPPNAPSPKAPPRSAVPAQKPLPPPAWVLPQDPNDQEPWPDPPAPAWPDPPAAAGPDPAAAAWPESPAGYVDEPDPGLTAEGAFGGGRPDDGRRFGLGAFDPGRRGVKALAAVAAVVLVVAALLAWRSRPRVDPVAPPSFEVTEATTAPAGRGGASSAATDVVVAVGGKVRKPGLVHLPPGARVADALTAAGGADPGVDVALLNLARKVVDGELIMVGVTPSPGVALPAGPAATGAAAPGGLVNLNTATLADLDTLPGVGPVLAQRILDARDAQGGFRAVSDLRKVDGIGDARYEQLKDLVTV
jgi:competence protein ComEA